MCLSYPPLGGEETTTLSFNGDSRALTRARFPTLPALKRLNLSDNPISGGLEYLVSACPALESLELSNTKLTSVAALAPLAQLSHLRRLDVRYCPLASGSLGTQVQSLLPQLASLIDDDEDEDFEDEDEEEDEDEGDEEEGDDDGDEEEEDDSPGTAFLLHGNADDLADEDDFAGEEEPESEDIDEEEGDEDEDGDAAAAAAKKPRTQ